MQQKLKLPSALVIQSYDFLCSLFISRYPRGQFWPHLSVWEWVVALGDSTFGLWQCSYPKRPLYGIYKHTSSVSHAPPLSLSFSGIFLHDLFIFSLSLFPSVSLYPLFHCLISWILCSFLSTSHWNLGQNSQLLWIKGQCWTNAEVDIRFSSTINQ